MRRRVPYLEERAKNKWRKLLRYQSCFSIDPRHGAALGLGRQRRWRQDIPQDQNVVVVCGAFRPEKPDGSQHKPLMTNASLLRFKPASCVCVLFP
ncbi:hypothetical protein Poly41_05190 [Novipirellula artificiosorum]|uniref:Uncharacterized protein n=1 Tax=Novipirellula artificiosorum TaxID=2528016 RepID=A0A5C6DXQ5_9BACT|nr:hypothetical protein Poly41_05190 [Novipirellula artificiosorum]